jgi:rfaE bifunctional protein nucleotidyltransferase chain/domain
MYDTTENISFLTDELQGKNIIFTNGCFDVVHPGHVEYLDKAKEHGDVLIVGLNSDKSVQRLKGLNRPINNEISRARVLLGLKSVDYVVIFNDNTPLELIKKIEPNVLIKGGDYDPEEKNPDSSKYIVGKNYAESTKVITFVDGHSTTNTINNILNKNSAAISTIIA